MPVFQLTDDLIFPHPELAEPEGLLAIGGDLSPDRLILAYSNGIFPWYNEGEPILWWSLDPRLILYPHKFKCSNSLYRTIKSNKYDVKINTNFNEVIKNCADIMRKEGAGTWINNDMIQAYSQMHKLGYAHSFETYYNEELVGGLYGMAFGKVFIGESMFYKMRDASKVAFFYLVEFAQRYNIQFIDAQQSTSHLKSLGAEEISRKKYLELLYKYIS